MNTETKLEVTWRSAAVKSMSMNRNNISLILKVTHFDKRVQQEWRGTIDGHGFHRDRLNQNRRRGGNITCQACDRASLRSHITEPQSLSSVYYTGLWGEIDLKWQLLGPVLETRRTVCRDSPLWSSWSHDVHQAVVWSYQDAVADVWLHFGFYKSEFFLLKRIDVLVSYRNKE